jgi:hypothetical protein
MAYLGSWQGMLGKEKELDYATGVSWFVWVVEGFRMIAISSVCVTSN